LLTACEQAVSKGQKDLMIEMQGKQKVIRGSNASLSSTLHKISKVNSLTWNCRLFAGISTCKLSANLYDIYHCCVYSEKLLMMDRGTVRNM